MEEVKENIESEVPKETLPLDDGDQGKDRRNWLRLQSSQFKSKVELQDDDEAKFPEDCYSFIALGCSPDNYIPFAYAMLVFTFQITFLVLMLCSKIFRKLAFNEDVDNPTEDLEGAFFATFIPANTSVIVKITQFVAISAFILFAEDSISDVVDAVRYYPLNPIFSKEHLFVKISCFFRFAQGIGACITALLLVMTSADVIDIVLNFTAVNFVSAMDDAAFELASSGRYGATLKAKAAEIADDLKLDFKCLHQLKDEKVVVVTEEGDEKEEERDIKYKWYIPVIAIVTTLLVGLMIHINVKQESENSWVADYFRVEFDDETGLTEYSGCYRKTRYQDRRPSYESFQNGPQPSATMAYCKASRRWVFHKEGGDRCDDGDGSHLAESGKTNVFDVSTVFELDFFSPFKKPLEMYFIDETDEALLYCDEFQGDGKCDINLNSYDFQYDGGDCCGMTCESEGCGNGNIAPFTAFNRPFDTKGTIGFPTCMDPEMEDVTITLNEIYFEDIGNEEWEEDLWISFWNPKLDLLCNDLKVFSVPVDKSMFGQSYTPKVFPMTNCTLIAENFEPLFGSLGIYFPVIQQISSNSSNSTNVGLDIIAKNSIPADLVKVKDLLENGILKFSGNYTMKGTIPTDIGRLKSVTTIILSQNELRGRIPPDIGSLELLSTLQLGSNQLTGPIPLELSLLTDLTVLELGNNQLEGTIPTEIGLLTNLVTLDLRDNMLTGLVPVEEIEQLPNLKNLFLDGNNVKGIINCTKIVNIGNLEDCQTRNSFPRWDSEAPTQSFAPTDAPSVSNAPSISPAPTITPVPTEFNLFDDTDMPSTSPSNSTDSPTSMPSSLPTPSCYSIADLLCRETEFEQMCELMRAVDGAEEMLTNFTYTVFAPTSAGLSRYYTDGGVKFNFEELFWFHTVEDEELRKDDLPCDAGLNLVGMSNGQNSRTLCNRSGKPIGQKGRDNELPVPFVAFDMEACNGVIHTIADVLLYRNDV
jgi:hypothetical protein